VILDYFAILGKKDTDARSNKSIMIYQMRQGFCCGIFRVYAWVLNMCKYAKVLTQ